MKDEVLVRLRIGKVFITPGAMQTLFQAKMSGVALLLRHIRGDWGDVSAGDKKANDEALRTGERILSAYALPKTGEKVWIITEWDRSLTTLLLPSEY